VLHPFQNMRELAQAFRIGNRPRVTTLKTLNLTQGHRIFIIPAGKITKS
jgi:hypothetical protein